MDQPKSKRQQEIDEAKEREKAVVREQLERDPIQAQLDREAAERDAALKGKGLGVDAPEVVTRKEDGSAVVQAHSPDVDPNTDPATQGDHDGVVEPGDKSRHIDVAKMGAGKQVDASGSTEPAHPGVRGDIGGSNLAGGSVEVLSDEEKRRRHQLPNGEGQPDGDPEHNSSDGSRR